MQILLKMAIATINICFELKLFRVSLKLLLTAKQRSWIRLVLMYKNVKV